MWSKIQTDLVDGELPGNRADYRNTKYINDIGLYVGEYDGPAQAEHSAYVGEWPIIEVQYEKMITGDELINLFEFDEWDELLDLTNAQVVKIIKMLPGRTRKFSIEHTKVVAFLTYVRNNTGLTAARALEISKGKPL